MNWTAISIAAGVIAVIGAVAYWFACQEQKANPTGRQEELDPHEREKARERASSITNVNGGGGSSL